MAAEKPETLVGLARANRSRAHEGNAVKKLFFSVDDLAERWGIPAAQVGQYGADGLLQFGVCIDGYLHVEIGTYGPPPELVFKVSAAGVWSDFIPVTKGTVATCWLHGYADHIEIPDTSPGERVRVVTCPPPLQDKTAPYAGT